MRMSLGTTPLASTYEELRMRELRNGEKGSEMVINIMIRPRGGDFVYTSSELDEMIISLSEFSDLQADGFVFGCLDTNNRNAPSSHF